VPGRTFSADEECGMLGGLELLGILAVIVGLIGIVVLVKGRKKT
jgi:hypothetical protein